MQHLASYSKTGRVLLRPECSGQGTEVHSGEGSGEMGSTKGETSGESRALADRILRDLSRLHGVALCVDTITSAAGHSTGSTILQT